MLLRNRKKQYIIKPPDCDSAILAEEPKSVDYYSKVAKSYRVSGYGGALDFFMAENCRSWVRFYWQWMVRGRVKFHRVSASHRDMISPENLPDLARALCRVIEDVEQKSGHQHTNQNSDGDHNS